MDFKIIVIIISFVFICFLLFNEWKRKDKSRLFVRLLASLSAVGAFILLILPLKYSVNRQSSTHQLHLLTAGFNKDSIPKSLKLFTADNSVMKENPSLKVTLIPDLSYFLGIHPEIQQIDGYGFGLNSSELAKLKSYSYRFHPANYPSGFQSVSWNPQIAATQTLKVQGIYQNPENQAIKLILSGLGTPLDSVLIAPKSAASFSLFNAPKQNAYSVYNLLALSGKDTLSVEEIPFEVLAKSPVKVLLLASAPDFEFKFLKNWLYDHQYPVVFRSRISKDKFAIDFLNHKTINVNKINQQLLQQFDLLLADDAELALLNGNEKSALEKQIEQGMGLIIRMNENKLLSTFSKRFSISTGLATKDKPAALKLAHEEKMLQPLSINQEIYFNLKNGNQPIVENQDGKFLVNSILFGAGKMVATAIPTTYNWVLNDFGNDYSRYWSEIMSKAAKKADQQIQYEITPNFPTPLFPSEIAVTLNTGEKLNHLQINSTLLSPQQNKYLPYLWNVLFWPQQKGWKTMKINDQFLSSFYVYDENGWKSVRNINRIKVNLQFSKNQFHKPLEISNKSAKEEIEISKWWFFFLFLISAGYLWFEARII